MEDGNDSADGLPVERIRQASRCGTCVGCALRTTWGTCREWKGCLASNGCVEWRRSCIEWPPVHVPGRQQTPSSIGLTDLQGVKWELTNLKAAMSQFEEFLTQYLVEGEVSDPPMAEYHIYHPRDFIREEFAAQFRRISEDPTGYIQVVNRAYREDCTTRVMRPPQGTGAEPHGTNSPPSGQNQDQEEENPREGPKESTGPNLKQTGKVWTGALM
jgi:hypothetical protein